MSRGFTLIELLITIAILALIAGIGIPVSRTFLTQNDTSSTAALTTQSLHRAQILAQGVLHDSPWGVKVAPGAITVFSGTSYANRDQSRDETTIISSGMTISGTSEFVFSKQTGYPVAVGSLQLTSPTNETVTITVNEKGTISY